MIISIDNKLATPEQADVIYNLTCLRCGQKFRFNDKRIVFVQLSNGQILAWHGVKNQKKGGYPCLTLVRQEVISKKPARKCQPTTKCATCGKVTKGRHATYCSKECRFETVADKPFLQRFLGIK